MSQGKQLDAFCRNINLLKRKNKLSNKALAHIMGVSPETVSRLLAGEVPPRLKVDALIRLCNHFYLLPSELLR